jgi:hypothetical protein
MRFFSSKRTREAAAEGNGLTPLPEGVDDNKYLAASANAAIVDKNSGAYDRHLFGEREIPSMPYENAVDHHLDLMSLRLGQKFIRHISRARKIMITASARRERLALRRGFFERRSKDLTAQLAEQEEILRGSKPGAHGLLWPGHPQDFHGRGSAFLRLMMKPMVFVLVGLVDLGIVYLSFINLAFGQVEAVILTLPALGAQLALPHLAGGRIGLALRTPATERKRKWTLALEATVMLGIWIVFVVAISWIRTEFIVSEYRQGGKNPDEFLQTIFLALSLVLMIALGGWLLFLALRENDHELRALRLKMTIHSTDLASIRFEKKVSRLDLRVSIAQETISAFLEEQENALTASRRSLGEAAKAVYRRALINQEGDPEFTSSYFGAAKIKTKTESEKE